MYELMQIYSCTYLCKFLCNIQGVQENVFFPRIFRVVPPLPLQYWAALGCPENASQPTCRGWVVVSNWGKKTCFFFNTMYIKILSIFLSMNPCNKLLCPIPAPRVHIFIFLYRVFYNNNTGFHISIQGVQ